MGSLTRPLRLYRLGCATQVSPSPRLHDPGDPLPSPAPPHLAKATDSLERAPRAVTTGDARGPTSALREREGGVEDADFARLTGEEHLGQGHGTKTRAILESGGGLVADSARRAGGDGRRACDRRSFCVGTGPSARVEAVLAAANGGGGGRSRPPIPETEARVGPAGGPTPQGVASTSWLPENSPDLQLPAPAQRRIG